VADIRDLFGEVLREARGVPEPRMSYALNRAAREFCRETWWLRRQVQFTCIVNQPAYTFPTVPNEDTLNVKHAQITQLTTASQLASTFPLRFSYGTIINPNTGPAQPRFLACVPYTQVYLDPYPDNVYPITLELVTQPIRDSEYIADELVTEFDQYLGSGALKWLLRQKGNDWYDPQGAADHDMLFKQGIVKGRIKAAYDFTPGQKEWISCGFMRYR
jgi:hypothetical protein